MTSGMAFPQFDPLRRPRPQFGDGSEKSPVRLVPPLSTAPAPAGDRLPLLDALRGFAILLMTLDHCASLGRVSVVAEHYLGRRTVLPDPLFVVIGLLTNLAAPMFWVMSGMSIAFLGRRFAQHRETGSSLTSFLVTRAGILLLIDTMIVSFLWAPALAIKHVYTFDLLSSIAVSMVLLLLLQRLPQRTFRGIGTVGWIGIALLVAYPLIWALAPQSWRTGGGFWLAAATQYSGGANPVVSFPVLAWSGLLLVGFAFGTRLEKPEWQSARRWSIVGGSLLCAWLLIRLGAGYGSIVPWHKSDGWQALFIMSKGPPGLDFMTFNLALGSFAVAAFCRWRARIEQHGWLMDLGRASLCIYVAHLVIYKVLAWFGLGILPNEAGLRYLVTWVAGLALLLPLARWWRGLKERHRAGMLRYL
jgi:uncharacterized membrane protein